MITDKFLNIICQHNANLYKPIYSSFCRQRIRGIYIIIPGSQRLSSSVTMSSPLIKCSRNSAKLSDSGNRPENPEITSSSALSLIFSESLFSGFSPSIYVFADLKSENNRRKYQLNVHAAYIKILQMWGRAKREATRRCTPDWGHNLVQGRIRRGGLPDTSDLRHFGPRSEVS